MNVEGLLSIGVYPEISLSEAREAYTAARKLLRNNINPSQKKQQDLKIARLNSENTFRAVALEWHTLNLEKWSKNYAGKILRGLELNIFLYIGNRPIKDIPAFSPSI